MENYISKLSSTLVSLDRRHVQLMILIITLILFVLGAGAPETGGGFSG